MTEFLSRKRWAIVGLLSASIAINLIDRQTLSVMAPLIRTALDLSPSQYGYITAAFQTGMLLGQVPAGALMDSLGTRLGLAAILGLWSLVSAGHAFAAGLGAWIGMRFCLGLTQCGNYTAGIKTIAGLFPAEQRSSAGGMFNAGAQLGSVVATPLIVYVATQYGWRAGFFIPSLVGLLWLIPWLVTFPKTGSRPRQEQKRGPQVRIGELIRNRKVFGLFLIRACSGPLTTFYWFWLPEYLKSGRKMSFAMIGALAWVPYLFGALGNVMGGFLSDRLVRVGGSVDRGRKLGFTFAFGLSALSMMLPLAGSDFTALAIVSAVLFGNQWVAATYIATVGDIVPHNLVGRVNGLAGIGDSSATLLATLLTGIIVQRYSYTPVFTAAGCLPLLATLSVFFVLRRIEPANIEATG
jgi:ACS family hexuronate transporter-like MFS transporter